MAATTTTTRRADWCQKHAFARPTKLRPSSDTTGNVTLPAQGHFSCFRRAGLASGISVAGNDPVNASDPSGLCNSQGNGNAWDLFNPWSSNNPIQCSVAKNPNSTTSQILEANPANVAITGYYNEWQATENGCGLGTELGFGAQGVAGVVGTLGIAAGGAGLAEGLLGSTADEAAPIAEDNVGHIFRDAPGHLAEDTPVNRAIIQGTVSPDNYVGTDSNGVATYRQVLPNGTQSWAELYQGQITNGGLNNVPR